MHNRFCTKGVECNEKDGNIRSVIEKGINTHYEKKEFSHTKRDFVKKV